MSGQVWTVPDETMREIGSWLILLADLLAIDSMDATAERIRQVIDSHEALSAPPRNGTP